MSFEHDHDIKVLQRNVKEMAREHLDFARCVVDDFKMIQKKIQITSILVLLSLLANLVLAILFLYSNWENLHVV